MNLIYFVTKKKKNCSKREMQDVKTFLFGRTEDYLKKALDYATLLKKEKQINSKFRMNPTFNFNQFRNT